MAEWLTWVFIVIGILFFVIDGFYTSRRFKRGEYGWYRSGWDKPWRLGPFRGGANAKAHCFLFTGERVTRLSFNLRYSFCRSRYMSYSGNWERIEDPSPDIMCTTCMDMVRRKTMMRFHLLPWKKSGGSEMSFMKALHWFISSVLVVSSLWIVLFDLTGEALGLSVNPPLFTIIAIFVLIGFGSEFILKLWWRV